MALRESISKKPALILGITAVVALLAMGWAYKSHLDQADEQPSLAYTTDDGATFFRDEINRTTPFEHNGKQAVRAYLFKCGENGTPFIGYLERNNAKAKAIIDKVNSGKGGTQPNPMDLMAVSQGKEIKKPGKGEWVPQNHPTAPAIIKQKCPDGSDALPAESL